MKIKLKPQLKSALLFTFSSSAQAANSLLKSNQVKFNIKPFSLSVSYERQIADYFTIFSEFDMRSGSGFYLSGYDFDQIWKVYSAELD